MKNYLTIDIGGTDMKYGVINDNSELVFKSLRPTNAHLGGENIIKQIKEIFAELSANYKLEGIAISSTGGIDDNTQMLTPSTSIIDYEKVNFRRDLAELNVNVSAENDVNSMALCEYSLLENTDKMKAVIALTVGTGIGGGIIVENKMHTGNAYTGGEIGKMIIRNNTSYEGLASTANLIKFVQEIYPEVTTGLEVFKLYDEGNKEVIKIVEQFYDDLATGLANLIYILNPDHIIIGGGVSNRGDKFLNELNTALKPKLWDYLQDKVVITLAKTKNDAGMIGAFKHYQRVFNN